MTVDVSVAIIEGVMESSDLHRVEDDLNESWIESWVGAGVEAIEQYLAKHLAFLAYLDDAAAA
jgi:hypothetical protein